MKTLDLSGRTAIVTGGSGQLGRSMCRALAECGANVALSYHSQQQYAEDLAKTMQESCGVRALAVHADVARKDSLIALKKAVNDALGTVNILVNNAVIQYEWKPVLEQNITDYESQFRSTVLPGVFMAQSFAPDMVAQNYGRIIGINTECAMQMLPNQSAYVAGKRRMDGVYKVPAREIGQYNITVNEVATGWTISDNSRNAAPQAHNTQQDFPYISTVLLHRRGTDDDIASAVCFWSVTLPPLSAACICPFAAAM